MLSKKYLIRDKKIFNALKHKGRRIKLPCFLISFLANRSARHNCLGIIISQKRIAQAVRRNQIRRRIKAIFSLFKQEPKTGFGFLNLIVVVLKEPSQKDYAQLNIFFKKFFV